MCAFQRTVDQTDFRYALGEQRVDDGPGGAAGPQDDRRTVIRPPSRHRVTQAFDKTEGVGIATDEQAVVINDDGIDGPDAARRRRGPVHQRQDLLLERNRHVDAPKSHLRQRCENSGQVIRANR